jgi:hypothetical protein
VCRPERQGRDIARHQPHDIADGEHRRHRSARRVDPQGDIGGGILGGEHEQLRGEQRSVVVVEHAVQHEGPPQQHLLPHPFAKQRVLLIVSHAFSLRDERPERPRTLM